MRIFPIAIALGLTLAGPALVASESTKMKGQDQNATEPARHRAQSAKMHKQHQTQDPSSQSGSGTVSTEGSTQKWRRWRQAPESRRYLFRDGVRIAAWRAGRGNDGHRAALPWRRGHFRIDPGGRTDNAV